MKNSYEVLLRSPRSAASCPLSLTATLFVQTDGMPPGVRASGACASGWRRALLLLLAEVVVPDFVDPLLPALLLGIVRPEVVRDVAVRFDVRLVAVVVFL